MEEDFNRLDNQRQNNRNHGKHLSCELLDLENVVKCKRYTVQLMQYQLLWVEHAIFYLVGYTIERQKTGSSESNQARTHYSAGL